MNSTEIRARPHTADVPEDLRVFAERMLALGVRLSLPTACAGDPVPEPLDLDGVGLSDAVLELRDRMDADNS